MNAGTSPKLSMPCPHRRQHGTALHRRELDGRNVGGAAGSRPKLHRTVQTPRDQADGEGQGERTPRRGCRFRRRAALHLRRRFTVHPSELPKTVRRGGGRAGGVRQHLTAGLPAAAGIHAPAQPDREQGVSVLFSWLFSQRLSDVLSPVKPCGAATTSPCARGWTLRRLRLLPLRRLLDSRSAKSPSTIWSDPTARRKSSASGTAASCCVSAGSARGVEMDLMHVKSVRPPASKNEHQ